MSIAPKIILLLIVAFMSSSFITKLYGLSKKKCLLFFFFLSTQKYRLFTPRIKNLKFLFLKANNVKWYYLFRYKIFCIQNLYSRYFKLFAKTRIVHVKVSHYYGIYARETPMVFIYVWEHLTLKISWLFEHAIVSKCTSSCRKMRS